ncbi:hypothetical protein, partial [Burkholderia pseudomallei]
SPSGSRTGFFLLCRRPMRGEAARRRSWPPRREVRRRRTGVTHAGAPAGVPSAGGLRGRVCMRRGIGGAPGATKSATSPLMPARAHPARSRDGRCENERRACTPRRFVTHVVTPAAPVRFDECAACIQPRNRSAAFQGCNPNRLGAIA